MNFVEFNQFNKLGKSELKEIIGGKHVGGCATGAGSYQTEGGCTINYSADSNHIYTDAADNWTQYHTESSVYPGTDISCYEEKCVEKEK
jgi:hypothetical protein